MENNQLTSGKAYSMTNPVNISIRCISPASSENESGLSEEDDVLDVDEDMRVWPNESLPDLEINVFAFSVST
jgi:hypothetical protein